MEEEWEETRKKRVDRNMHIEIQDDVEKDTYIR
jgi:hypothetical protein